MVRLNGEETVLTVGDAETRGAYAARLNTAPPGFAAVVGPDALDDALREADVLVLSGGVSMGRYDFTKAALHALGAPRDPLQELCSGGLIGADTRISEEADGRSDRRQWGPQFVRSIRDESPRAAVRIGMASNRAVRSE